MSRKPGYISYLLRLRQMKSNHHTIWVASVQNTATGELTGFPGINELADFLQAEFGGDETAPDPEQGPATYITSNTR